MYSAPRPLSLHLPGQDHHSVNPLLSQRARSLSASQTSLASNFSKLSFKLSKVFGSKPKLKDPNKSSSEKMKRKLPDPQHCSQELPYIAFQRPHIPPAVDSREQHFSAIVGWTQQRSGKRRETRDLPDLVKHERWELLAVVPGGCLTLPWGFHHSSLSFV